MPLGAHVAGGVQVVVTTSGAPAVAPPPSLVPKGVESPSSSASDTIVLSQTSPPEMLWAEVQSLRAQVATLSEAKSNDLVSFQQVYREVATMSIQLGEMRDEFKEVISAATDGFQSLLKAVILQKGSNAKHRHFVATATAELKGLKDHVFAAVESMKDITFATARRFLANEPDPLERSLIQELHRVVLAMCTTQARVHLHRREEFTTCAPLSWNAMSHLIDAAPHAIVTLQECLEEQSRLGESLGLMGLRMDQLNGDLERCMNDNIRLKTFLMDYVEQSERDHLITAQLCFGANGMGPSLTLESPVESYIDALKKILQMRQTEEMIAKHSFQSLQLRPVGLLTSGPSTKVEIVKNHTTLEMQCKALQSKEMSQRKQHIRTKLQLAVQKVLNDLLKFRCRRVLSIAHVHYRSLRIKYHDLLRAHADLSVQHQIAMTQLNGSANANGGTMSNGMLKVQSVQPFGGGTAPSESATTVQETEDLMDSWKRQSTASGPPADSPRQTSARKGSRKSASLPSDPHTPKVRGTHPESFDFPLPLAPPVVGSSKKSGSASFRNYVEQLESKAAGSNSAPRERKVSGSASSVRDNGVLASRDPPLLKSGPQPIGSSQRQFDFTVPQGDSQKIPNIVTSPRQRYSFRPPLT